MNQSITQVVINLNGIVFKEFIQNNIIKCMIFNVANFFDTSISVQNQSYLYTLKFLYFFFDKKINLIICLFVLVGSNRFLFIRSKNDAYTTTAKISNDLCINLCKNVHNKEHTKKYQLVA